MKYSSILDAVGNTPLVEVPHLCPVDGVRMWVKLEGQNPTGSVKDRIAIALVEAGEASGDLTPDKIILEPTSGNTGIALAMVASTRGYRFTAVMPDNASAERVQLLTAFGAEIIFSEGAKGTNGSVAMALELAKDPKYHMPFQYGNTANIDAHYKGTGQEIVDDLPEVKAFVAGLGTGGTLMGVGKRLKEHNPDVRIVAAEPKLGELVYGLRSLEDGYIPPIFDPDAIDGKVMVSARDSILWTRELLRKEGIFAGISAGAVIWVAQRVAERLAEDGGGDIACLLPDGGWKYMSTEAWTQDIDTAESQVEEVLWW
ncbi:MAG: [CysO sulfur-carrier protein]-thiocarboxylate-dependent cysteine synthase [Actinomycetota bacterium]|jgi:cysteine synthase B|nr:[CysO sulfur-carrier protein]-thiocarboxylate-dependent cysteine synthase [Actinomycetota bacterium]